MTTSNDKKLKILLECYQPGTVILASWLAKIGISYDLQQYYRKSGWLETIGSGAFKKPNDLVRWEGAVYALQTQAQLPIHAGALTALSLQGLAHYARTANEKIFLFSSTTVNLPAWFKNYTWDNPVQHVRTSMLPEALGIQAHEEKIGTLQLATPERSMMECLYLAPHALDIVECYQIMEGLVNLRPNLVQTLLEQCSSVKVKRLFLYMADKAQHSWLQWLDRSTLDLGKGDRSIVPGGAYVAKYHITVPKELVTQ